MLLLEDKLEEIKKLRNEQKLTAEQIAKKFNVGVGFVYRLNNKFKIFEGRVLKEYPQEKIDKVLKFYPKLLSTRKVARIARLKQWEIMEILNKYNIPRRRAGYFNWDRKYTINENFFEKIDTPEKAHVLGLLMADGNVVSHTDKRQKSYSCNICLHENDRVFLEGIRDIMGINSPLANVKNSKCKLLRFSSKKMREDLIKLDCIPNKSLVLQFPTSEQVPDHLMQYLIKGEFEGDGWVTKNYERPSYSIGVCGSPDFINGLDKYCQEKYDVHGMNTKDRNIRRLIWSRIDDVKKLCTLFYDGKTISMERKKNLLLKFLEIRKKIDDHPKRKTVDGINYKNCVICNEYKTLENFGIRRRNFDGLEDLCRGCKSKEDKAYHQRRKERERLKNTIIDYQI